MDKHSYRRCATSAFKEEFCVKFDVDSYAFWFGCSCLFRCRHTQLLIYRYQVTVLRASCVPEKVGFCQKAQIKTYTATVKKDLFEQINQPENVNPKIRGGKLKRVVNWHEALKQEGVQRHTGVYTVWLITQLHAITWLKTNGAPFPLPLYVLIACAGATLSFHTYTHTHNVCVYVCVW